MSSGGVVTYPEIIVNILQSEDEYFGRDIFGVLDVGAIMTRQVCVHNEESTWEDASQSCLHILHCFNKVTVET